ncbi:RNase P/RNase MRP complex subunit [Umbelopsis nana]
MSNSTNSVDKAKSVGGSSSDSKVNDPGSATALPALLKEYLPAETDVQDIIRNRIQGKKVHIDSADTTNKPKKKTKSKIKRITSREKRQLGIYTIPAHCHKYDLFVPLHQLWLGYIDELLASNASPLVHSQKLIKADYHGAIMTVVKSKCPSYIGTTGILVQETENMLNIITKENKLKHVPKAASVFNLTVKGTTFTIYGNQIRFRASDRATRKFKIKPTIDL